MNALTMRGLALVFTLLLSTSVAAAPKASTISLEISSPTNGASYTTDAATIDVGLVFNGVRGSVAVTWSSDRGGSGSAAFMGKNAYVAGGIPLAAESNTLTFTGTDKSGASYFATLVVQREGPTADETEVANQPPEISGDPASSVLAGEAYSFQPEASDPDGDAVGFSISGKPSWASFDTLTGRLSGTPDSADVGPGSDIEIAVSDGIAVVALEPFAIEVLEPPPGDAAATLSWTPPTEREDGSALTDLAGYSIHYGNSPDALTQTIVIDTAGLSSYVVEGLSSGSWYFGMKAVDTQGYESSLSAVVSKTIS
ncbi:MAG TPA: putative Ig domain-containing protein [Gammaproteobacteria bacterium]|nr:putative Ig domain-containing protein [Gammaproteobacteria bacterium]